MLCALLACQSDDEALFEATIDNADESYACIAGRFPFEPKHFAVVRAENSALIRMVDQTRDRLRSDGLYIAIAEGTHLDNGQPCPQIEEISRRDVAVGPDQCVQVYLRFGSCERNAVTMHLFGNASFESLQFSAGKQIQGQLYGTLEEITYYEVLGERRLHREGLGSFSGHFSFEVRQGPTYQLFSTKPTHPHAL